MPTRSRVQTRPSLTIGAWTGRMRASSVALLSACIAIFLALTLFGVATAERKASRAGKDPDRSVMAQAGGSPDGRLGVDSRLGDILHHPAFAEFGRLLLPWDGRTYDEDLRLRDIGSLLPYHSHVSPQLVVNALNHMIEDARNGRTIFYDIYSDAQKRDEPARAFTGLFFFRGSPGAPFAIIAPGGGFSYVGSVHEGFPHAVEISKKGYNAFVLKYRAGYGGTVATQDLAAAISYVLRNAEALGVSTDTYSLWGSSAGARMVAAIGTYGVAAYGGDDLPRPADHRHGLHGSFRPLVGRASNVRCRRRERRHRSARHDGKARCGASAGRRRSRVSQIQRSRSRLRARQRYECRRMGPRCHSVLGKVHAAKALTASLSGDLACWGDDRRGGWRCQSPQGLDRVAV